MQPGPTSPGMFMIVGQVLLEVFAVPAALDEIFLAFEEDGVESLGGLGVAHALGPFFAGPQGRQIVADMNVVTPCKCLDRRCSIGRPRACRRARRPRQSRRGR